MGDRTYSPFEDYLGFAKMVFPWSSETNEKSSYVKQIDFDSPGDTKKKSARKIRQRTVQRSDVEVGIEDQQQVPGLKQKSTFGEFPEFAEGGRTIRNWKTSVDNGKEGTRGHREVRRKFSKTAEWKVSGDTTAFREMTESTDGGRAIRNRRVSGENVSGVTREHYEDSRKFSDVAECNVSSVTSAFKDLPEVAEGSRSISERKISIDNVKRDTCREHHERNRRKYSETTEWNVSDVTSFDRDEVLSSCSDLRRTVPRYSSSDLAASVEEIEQLVTAVVHKKMKERHNRSNVCVFCQRNGETWEYYTTHTLKDNHGKVICPVLRKYRCPQCDATGDNAHTLRHCPLSATSSSVSETFKTPRMSYGFRKYPE